MLTALIGLLLGGGGLAFLTNGFRGLSSLRSGAIAREREAVDDLGRRFRTSEGDRDFWRRTASGYAGQLERAGIKPVPPDPVPPSERT